MLNKKEDYVYLTQKALERIKIDGSVFPFRNGKMALIGEDVAFLKEAILERTSMKYGIDPEKNKDVIQKIEKGFIDASYTSVKEILGWNWIKKNAILPEEGLVFNVEGEYDYDEEIEVKRKIEELRRKAAEDINKEKQEFKNYLAGYWDESGEYHQGEIKRFRDEVNKVTTDKNTEIRRIKEEHWNDETVIAQAYNNSRKEEEKEHEKKLGELQKQYKEKKIEREEYEKKVGEENIRNDNALRKLSRELLKDTRLARETVNKEIWELEEAAEKEIHDKYVSEIDKLLVEYHAIDASLDGAVRQASKDSYKLAQEGVAPRVGVPTSISSFYSMASSPKMFSAYDKVEKDRIFASCCYPWYARANAYLDLSPYYIWGGREDKNMARTVISSPSSTAINRVYADIERMNTVCKEGIGAYHSACIDNYNYGDSSESYRTYAGAGGLNPLVLYGGTFGISEGIDEEGKTHKTKATVDGLKACFRIGTRNNVNNIEGINVLFMRQDSEDYEKRVRKSADVFRKGQYGYEVIEGMEWQAQQVLNDANSWLSWGEPQFTTSDPPYVRYGEPLAKYWWNEWVSHKHRVGYFLNSYSATNEGVQASSTLKALDECDDKYNKLLEENEENKNKKLKEIKEAYDNDVANKEEEVGKQISEIEKDRDDRIAKIYADMWSSIFPMLPSVNKDIKDGEYEYSEFYDNVIAPKIEKFVIDRAAIEKSAENEIKDKKDALSEWEKERKKTYNTDVKEAKKPFEEEEKKIIKKWKYNPGKPKEGESDERGERIKIIDDYNDKRDDVEKEYKDAKKSALKTFNSTQWTNIENAERDCVAINKDVSIGVSDNGLWLVAYIENPEDITSKQYDQMAPILVDCYNKNEAAWKSYKNACDEADDKRWHKMKDFEELNETNRGKWTFEAEQEGIQSFALDGPLSSHHIEHYWVGIVAAYVKFKPNTMTGVDFDKYYTEVDEKYKRHKYS